MLRRRQHPEDRHGDAREGERDERHAHPETVRPASHGQRRAAGGEARTGRGFAVAGLVGLAGGRAAPPAGGRQGQGGQCEPCRQRQPAEHPGDGRRAGLHAAVAVGERDRSARGAVDDAEPRQPVEGADHPSQTPMPRVRRVDRDHAIARRRHRPDDEGGNRQVGEDLDRGRDLDRDVEAHRDPHGRVAGGPPPQADRDEQLGDHDQLGADRVERAVCEQRDRPSGERRGVQAVTHLHDPVPRDGAAEPVGVDELAHARRPVDHRGLEPQQPQRPRGGARIERRLTPPLPEPRIHRQLAPTWGDRQRRQHDHEIGAVAVDVRGREEQVVGDDAEGRARRHPGAEPQRHRHRRDDADGQQGAVEGTGKLGIPRRVRLVERVAIDPAGQRVGDERAQVQQRHRPDEDPQQRQGPHADAPPEQFVHRADEARGPGGHGRRGHAGVRPVVAAQHRHLGPVGVVPRRDPAPRDSGSRRPAACCPAT